MAQDVVLVALRDSASARDVERQLRELRLRVFRFQLGRSRLVVEQLQGCQAALCVLCSQKLQASDDVGLDDLKGLATALPLLVLDDSFDALFGRSLIEAGAQDYLDVQRIDEEELKNRIEWAVLRSERTPEIGASRPGRDVSSPARANNGSSRRASRNGSAAIEVEADWSALAGIYRAVPPRERAVLDLLLDGLDPKEIAKRLGTRWATVRNQIARLRSRFSARSRQHLVVLAVRAKLMGQRTA